MRKILLFLLLGITAITLTACKETTTPDPVVVTYTVTFDSDGGSAVTAQEINEGERASSPSAPSKEGFDFTLWYETDNTVAFDFNTEINADVTLMAHWTVAEVVITDTELIEADIAAWEAEMYREDNYLRLRGTGDVNSSRITWSFESDYITEDGIILPLQYGMEDTTTVLTGSFKLNDTTVSKTFDIPLSTMGDVVINNMVSVPFENLTTEYDVIDGNIDLYFEEGGNVPYVALTDFFDLLDGFIDPDTIFTVDTTDGILTISYEYYDEDEDVTYDMILTVDSVENTVVVNDPSFYSAYVYYTETNYGRHIEYDFDNPLSSFDEGDEVVYDLDEYGMDIVLYNGEILLPYYMTNQLFAGSSYYNIYYNVDGLYGIYSLPDAGSDELDTILTSSANFGDIPVDLLIHTFNMLAFDLDYLYGLKDIMEVDSYYALLYEQINNIVTVDAQEFDEALQVLILKEMDEPHTSYGYHSFYNSTFYDGPTLTSLNQFGTRVKSWYNDGLYASDDAIEAKWGNTGDGWAANSRPHYWFLDDVTVMLSLDGFDTADIEVSYVYDATLNDPVLEVTDSSTILPVISQGNKFWVYNNSTEDENILEIIVKGVTASYLDDYKAALVAKGYTLVSETSEEEGKLTGYYTMTVVEDLVSTDYMVQVTYDVEYSLFYVSVVDEVPALYTDEWVLIVDVEALVASDSAVFLELELDKIMIEKPLVEDIILDLSFNTGGNIGALYRVIGFITDDPFKVSSIDRDTNGSSTYFVDIDSGVPSYAHLNWALLTTPTTFSAANELATIFKSNEFGPIIGITSGGGACSITPILLPNGTAFTMSSNNIMAYRTGTDTEADPYVFHHTEFGIVPDHQIEMTEIFDAAVILAILNP